MPTRLAPFLLALLAGPTLGAAAPQGSPEEGMGEERLERFRAYLQAAPYHERAFQGLLHEARAAGRLDSLLEDYRARLAANPEDRAARVLLARLLASDGHPREALTTLGDVDPERAQSWRLRSRLALALGSPAAVDRARRDLVLALERVGEDRDLRHELLLERAALEQLAGDRDAARKTLLALAEGQELDPRELAGVADHLADARFEGEAIALLEQALTAAGDDGPTRVQLCAALGRLHENRNEGRAALARYGEALEHLGRGHWLARELLERSLALHRRAGTLSTAVETYRARLGQDPRDLDARDALVRALLLGGRRHEAARELAAAVALDPADLDLSDRYAALLAELGQRLAHLAELQRQLALVPRDRPRRLALGRALARGGDLAGAEREWARLLESPGAGVADELAVARAWEELGEPERARERYAGALEWDPRSIEACGALARLLAQAGRQRSALGVLGRTELGLAGQPGNLEALAEHYLALDAPRDARRALLAAEGADPGRAWRRERLAQIALAEVRSGGVSGWAPGGKRREAADALLSWLDLTRDAGSRSRALDHYVQLFPGARGEAELARLGRATPENPENPENPEHPENPENCRGRGPDLARAALLRERGELAAAVEVLGHHLTRFPDDRVARLERVTGLERLGDVDGALAELETLEHLEPARGAEHGLAQVALLVGHQRHADAGARLDRVRGRFPRDAGTWIEIARWSARLGDRPGAIGALRRAVALEPERGEAHLELARRLAQAGDGPAAAESALEAWRTSRAGGGGRERAAALLHQLLANPREVGAELRRLRAAVRRNPYDVDTPRLVAELSLLEGDVTGALRTLDELLRRLGDEPDLLRSRARALARGGRHSACLRDLGRLAALGETVDDLALGLVSNALGQGDVRRALEAARLCTDAVEAARRFAARGEQGAALRVLEARARERGAAPGKATGEATGEELTYAAELHRVSGAPRRALRVLEQLQAREGVSWQVAAERGKLSRILGDWRSVHERGAELLLLGAPDRVLESWFVDDDERALAVQRLCVDLRRDVQDGARLEAGLVALSADPRDARVALDLVRGLRRRASGPRPAGHTPASWSQVLDGWILELLAAHPELRERRLEQLARRGRSATADEVLERLWLDPFAEGTRAGRTPAGLTLAGEALERFGQDPRVVDAAARAAALGGARGGYGDLELSASRRLCALLDGEAEREREAALRALATQRAAREAREAHRGGPGLGPGDPLAPRLARLALDPADGWPAAPPVRRALAAARHARALVCAGRRTEARRVLAALDPPQPEALVERVERGELWLWAGLWGDAARSLLAVARDRAALEDDLDLDDEGPGLDDEGHLAPHAAWRAAVDGRLATLALRLGLALLARGAGPCERRL